MELDDLKSVWKSLDQRLVQQNALAFELLRSKKLPRVRSALRPLVFGQLVQVAAGIVMLCLFVPFWLKYTQVPHLLVCGVLLHAYAIMLIAFAGQELQLIWSIDYSAPVVAIQKDIAKLRNWRVRIAPIFGVAGCFIWIPFMLVVFRWLGVDVWARSPEVVLWFIASGFVAFGIMVAIIWWSRRPGRADRVKSLGDQSAGWSVHRAQRALDEIARFEQCEPA